MTETTTRKNYKLDTDEKVFFYEQEFYVLSNFSSFMLQWKDNLFLSSEVAYHWEKFVDIDLDMFRFSDDKIIYENLNNIRTEIRNRLMSARSSHAAFELAQTYKEWRRKDWDNQKVGIMKRILLEKVRQHPYVKKKLLETGNRLLVEDSWRDDYWGIGPNGDGQNMLGKLWMEVREQVRGN